MRAACNPGSAEQRQSATNKRFTTSSNDTESQPSSPKSRIAHKAITALSNDFCAFVIFWWLAGLAVVRSTRRFSKLRLGMNQQVGESIARRQRPRQRKPRVTVDSRRSSSLTRGYNVSPASRLSEANAIMKERIKYVIDANQFRIPHLLPVKPTSIASNLLRCTISPMMFWGVQRIYWRA